MPLFSNNKSLQKYIVKSKFIQGAQNIKMQTKKSTNFEFMAKKLSP